MIFITGYMKEIGTHILTSSDHLHFFSIQYSTTYIKKLIDDNSPIDETLRFLGVSCHRFVYDHIALVLLMGKLGVLWCCYSRFVNGGLYNFVLSNTIPYRLPLYSLLI